MPSIPRTLCVTRASLGIRLYLGESCSPNQRVLVEQCGGYSCRLVYLFRYYRLVYLFHHSRHCFQRTGSLQQHLLPLSRARGGGHNPQVPPHDTLDALSLSAHESASLVVPRGHHTPPARTSIPCRNDISPPCCTQPPYKETACWTRKNRTPLFLEREPAPLSASRADPWVQQKVPFCRVFAIVRVVSMSRLPHICQSHLRLQGHMVLVVASHARALDAPLRAAFDAACETRAAVVPPRASFYLALRVQASLLSHYFFACMVVPLHIPAL